MSKVLCFIMLCLTFFANVAKAQNETKCGPAGFTGTPTKGFVSPVVIAGTANQKIASFTLFSDHTEARDVYAQSFNISVPQGLQVQNLITKINGVPQNFAVGFIQSGTYNFTPAKGTFRVLRCESVNIEVFVDVLSGTVAGTYASVNMTQVIANGAVTNTNQTLLHRSTGVPVTAINPLIGQPFTVMVSGGANLASVYSDITVSVNQEVHLGQWRLTANNAEDLRLLMLGVRFSQNGELGCNKVAYGRLVAETSQGPVSANFTVPSGTGSNFYTVVNFPGQGLTVSKNTTMLIRAIGFVRQECQASVIVTMIPSPSDVALYGTQSNLPIIVSGDFPSVGGIIRIQK